MAQTALRGATGLELTPGSVGTTGGLMGVALGSYQHLVGFLADTHQPSSRTHTTRCELQDGAPQRRLRHRGVGAVELVAAAVQAC
jgi:hypothetical protein